MPVAARRLETGVVPRCAAASHDHCRHSFARLGQGGDAVARGLLRGGEYHFGDLALGPAVGGGRVPLVVELLSPAHRPVQVTRDLASFWRSGYFEVKKDLKGRYPKHYWPDDPLQAQATSRVRPRPG